MHTYVRTYIHNIQTNKYSANEARASLSASRARVALVVIPTPRAGARRSRRDVATSLSTRLRHAEVGPAHEAVRFGERKEADRAHELEHDGRAPERALAREQARVPALVPALRGESEMREETRGAGVNARARGRKQRARGKTRRREKGPARANRARALTSGEAGRRSGASPSALTDETALEADDTALAV